jgi:chemotaxis signal transduction protein
MPTAAHYLTLGLGSETFGIAVRHVREILDLGTIAALPQAPSFLLGMIDVRGEGVPVVDLRVKLGLEAIAATATTRIVILDVPVEGRATAVGFVADRVIAVSTLDSDHLDPAPSVGGRWHARSLAGIGRRDGAFVIVLCIDELMAYDGPALVLSPVAA